MRSKNEILEKFLDLYQRRLKERKKKYLSEIHLNCTYNRKSRIKDHGVLGFCGNDKITKQSRKFVVVCNNKETAEACPKFKCKHTEQSVEKDFIEILKSPSRCGEEYPKLAVLIWVLQNEHIKAGKQNINAEKDQKEREENLFGRKETGYWKNIINAVLGR
jgi:hypothetical protein